MAKVNCQSILGSPRWRALRSPATVLAQAERLFDPLADAQADIVAGMAGGPAIDGRTSPVGILRDVRCDVDLAEFSDKILRVEPFVASERDLLRDVRRTAR